jgi:hypothetical protein
MDTPRARRLANSLMLARMAPRSVCQVMTTPMTKPMDAEEGEEDGDECPPDIMSRVVAAVSSGLGPGAIEAVGHGVEFVADADRRLFPCRRSS